MWWLGHAQKPLSDTTLAYCPWSARERVDGWITLQVIESGFTIRPSHLLPPTRQGDNIEGDRHNTSIVNPHTPSLPAQSMEPFLRFRTRNSTQYSGEARTGHRLLLLWGPGSGSGWP
jgi:hypothetical protein